MQVHFLGTGAAEGIPNFGCACPRCQLARDDGGPNVRKRASVLITTEEQRILVDTPPEISLLLNQADIFELSAIFLSHEHFDHIGGLTEFEYWKQVLPIFAGYDVLPQIRLTPRLAERGLLSACHAHARLYFGDLQVMPFKVPHHVPCYGFLFEEGGKRVVHFSDASSELGDIHRYLAQHADLVIFHTPTFGTHAHHLGVEDVIALREAWSLKQAVITHINHDNLSHSELVETLEPYRITVAYDGLVMEV